MSKIPEGERYITAKFESADIRPGHPIYIRVTGLPDVNGSSSVQTWQFVEKIGKIGLVFQDGTMIPWDEFPQRDGPVNVRLVSIEGGYLPIADFFPPFTEKI